VKRVRILVAEDHELMRDTVVRLLKQDFDVVDAVANGKALLEAAARLNPDVCVLDISMPLLNGIDAAMHLKHSHSSAKVIFLTIHNDSDSVSAGFRSGAEGYVFKIRMAADLVVAVRAVLAGRKFLSQNTLKTGETRSTSH
jgi:DNA-binding NarL/FixJ family response regulator